MSEKISLDSSELNYNLKSLEANQQKQHLER